MTDWQQLQKLIKDSKLEGMPAPAGRPLIHVDSQLQLLNLIFEDEHRNRQYPVSTSRNGLGQCQGSEQTPAGIHRIAQKIGEGEPPGRVFKARQPLDRICLPQDYDGLDFFSFRVSDGELTSSPATV